MQPVCPLAGWPRPLFLAGSPTIRDSESVPYDRHISCTFLAARHAAPRETTTSIGLSRKLEAAHEPVVASGLAGGPASQGTNADRQEGLASAPERA